MRRALSQITLVIVRNSYVTHTLQLITESLARPNRVKRTGDSIRENEEGFFNFDKPVRGHPPGGDRLAVIGHMPTVVLSQKLLILSYCLRTMDSIVGSPYNRG